MSSSRSSDGLLRLVLVVLAVVVVVPLVMMALMMPMMGMVGWWWGDGAMGPGHAPLWGLGVMLLWLAVPVGIGYLLYRWLVRRDDRRADDPAVEELRLAYARGDLSEQEYEDRLDRLRAGE